MAGSELTFDLMYKLYISKSVKYIEQPKKIWLTFILVISCEKSALIDQFNAG